MFFSCGYLTLNCPAHLTFLLNLFLYCLAQEHAARPGGMFRPSLGDRVWTGILCREVPSRRCFVVWTTQHQLQKEKNMSMLWEQPTCDTWVKRSVSALQQVAAYATWDVLLGCVFCFLEKYENITVKEYAKIWICLSSFVIFPELRSWSKYALGCAFWKSRSFNKMYFSLWLSWGNAVFLQDILKAK